MESLGFPIQINFQAGLGGSNMRQAQNLDIMFGFGTDSNGNDKIVTRTVGKMYSKADGTGRRRPVSMFPVVLAQSLRDGRLEDHLDRNDYMYSTEIESYFGRLTPFEYVFCVGM